MYIDHTNILLLVLDWRWFFCPGSTGTGGAWPRPLAYHIIPNSYLDNISLRSLILVVYFCSNISSPMYGLLFYQRTWYALPSNGEEHHTLRFDTANSYWCTMLGQNLVIAVLSYTINICKIVDIFANISSKTCKLDTFWYKNIFFQHTPSTATAIQSIHWAFPR